MADKEINWILKAKDAASGPIGQVGRSLHSLHGAAARAGGGLQTLGGHLASFAKKVALIGTAAVVGGFVALEEVIRRSVGSANAYGVAVSRVQKITGLTTEASSRLVAVFQKFGLEAGDSIRTIGMLEKNVGKLTLSTKAEAKFEETFGFSLRKTGKAMEILTGKTIGSKVSADQLRIAHERLTVAQQHLNELEAKGTASLSTMTAARFRVGDATRKLAELEAKAGSSTTKWTKSLVSSTGAVKDANTLILQAADYFINKHIPATQKAAFEAALFGRNWQLLVPILALGSKGIKAAGDEAAKLGLVLTKQNATELAAYRLSTIQLGEAWGGFQLQIGLVVMPILTKLFAFITTTGIPAIRGFIKGVQDWFAAHQPLIQQLGKIASDLLPKVASFISNVVIPALMVLATWIGGVVSKISIWLRRNRDLVDAITQFVSGVLRTLIDALAKVIGWIATLIDKIASNRQAMDILRAAVGFLARAFGFLSSAVASILGWIGGFIDSLSKNKPLVASFQGVIANMGGAFRNAGGAIAFAAGQIGNLINWVRDAISWVQKLIDKLTHLSISFPHIPLPGFQHGGFIKPGQLAVVGEAGPEIIRGGRGGYTVTPMRSAPTAPAWSGVGGGGVPVEIPIIVDGQELARVMDRNLYYLKR